MPRRILIADDNQLIRKLVREAFEQQNWLVCAEAENGKQAVEKAKELKPDLILLDLSMPVMNGLDAARALKQLMPAVPMVMFTSFQTDQLRAQMLAAGVSTVIVKSNSLANLIDAIRTVMIDHAA